MKNWNTIRLDGTGPVRHLVLNRPESLNSINWEMLKEIEQVCRYIDEQGDIRVVILRGEGRVFCAGADLNESATERTKGEMMGRAKSGARAVDALTELTPITIAALHSHVVGGGSCFSMACDFRIGAESTQVSIPESRLGINLSWRSIPNAVHLVGPVRAKEMIIFGEAHPAQTMLEWGFLEQVVPDDELISAAEAKAKKVLAMPPLPTAMTKATINALVKNADRSVSHLDEQGLAFTFSSEDGKKSRENYRSGNPTSDWSNE